MTSLLRACSPALAAALAGNARLWSAELMTFTLTDGTVLRWTNFDRDLTYAGHTFTAGSPFSSRTSWKVTNTMEVPTLSLRLLAGVASFRGGASLEAQIASGLFDGAAFNLETAFMLTPGDVDTLGTIALFGGYVGPIDGGGVAYTLSIKGRNNDLDQYVPRGLYQVSCRHAFCDAGCTLDRADFTSSFAVGSSPTAAFIPWATPPATPALSVNGTLAMVDGDAAGSRRTIARATSGGIILSFPLASLPAPGDSFTAFQACDKTRNSGSGQSCTDRSNTDHYRGYPFTPPPTAAY